MKLFQKKVKNYIKIKLLKKGFRIQSLHYFNFLDSLLYQILRKQNTLKFLQIGANDGKRFDPIFEFVSVNHNKLEGVILEPIKDYYNELLTNYANYKNIVTVNKAIHNELKETTIYRLDKAKEHLAPEFAKGIASFNQHHHEKTNIPLDFMKAETVSCTNLNDLIQNYKLQNVDVVVIDTEGYDYHIIKAMDFNQIQPKVIHFEHGLKSKTMSLDQYKELKNLLQNNNYQIFVDEGDVTAYKTDILFSTIDEKNN